MMPSFDCVTNAMAQQKDGHHPTPPPQHITTPGPYSQFDLNLNLTV